MDLWPIGDKITCPQCKLEKKKSTVKISSGGTVTLLHVIDESYYDEDGVFHYIAPPKLNTYTRTATCSNGHQFTIKSKV